MKTLIISLSAKYIHSSLAPWYLKEACSHYAKDCGEVLVSEHTINENPDSVLSAIYLKKPDVAAFSCYIWNITQVLAIASNLKKLLPSLIIILGGPEVSYDAAQLLKANSFIDYIIKGEGESTFAQLTALLNSKEGKQGTDSANMIPGLAFRCENGIIDNGPVVIRDLDSIPSPYTDEMISSLNNKIVYFESSRGCPFSCSYCLSSVNEGVRYFSLHRVFKDLDRLVRSGAGQIKFVDRTFNVNIERSKKIIMYILELNKSLSGENEAVCNFHFEVGADLFDDETIDLLNSAPKGLFQLEAGVQSANRESLKAVCRKTDLERLLANLRRLRCCDNVHIHADLIAGLPFEDYQSFGQSFDTVYSTRPHQLQLGFLKLLKGTMLREQSMVHGYVFRDLAPYEILSANAISYNELIILKGIAELVERYYNSGRFEYSIEFLIERYFVSPFSFYESFYRFHIDNGLLGIPAAFRDQYKILNSFYINSISDQGAGKKTAEDGSFFEELLRLDFLAADNSGTLPDFMDKRGTPGMRDKCLEFLRDTERMKSVIPEAVDMTPKQILKHVHFEPIKLDYSSNVDTGEITFRSFCPATQANIFVFLYLSRDKVTARYKFHLLKI